MATLEDIKFQILAFLYSNKKANAKKLEEHVGCSNKTFLKARQQLEKDGLITKHYEQKPGGGLYAIYQLTPKGASFFLKEMEKREIIKMIDATAPEDIHKIKSSFFEFQKRAVFYGCKIILENSFYNLFRLAQIFSYIFEGGEMSENDLKNMIDWASEKISFYEKILKMMKESYSRFDFGLFVISDSGKRINLDEIEVKRSEAILERIKEMTACLQNIFEIHKKSGLPFKEICEKMEADFPAKHDYSSVLHFLEKIRKNLEDEDEMLIDILRLEPFSTE